MENRVLTLRELNRATLARQLVLERETLTPPEAIERVAGLQSQTTNAPYIGLWTRLRGFHRDELTRSMEHRQVVRATMMRSTLHLTTADDYLRLRPALQSALTRALRSFFGARAKGFNIDRLVTEAQAYLEQQPRTFTELRALLTSLEPDQDPEAMAYAVRTHLPLVQVPPGGVWGTGGSPAYALAEAWIGRPLSTTEELRFLVHRYLSAFGPASARDIQTWSGLTGLREPLKKLQAELHTFHDKQGNELFDLPDLPLPAADTPVPPRFLPEYDNLLLSHADRARVIPNEHRPRVFLSAGRVRATFLLDGFVRGTWKTERSPGTATLVIEPFISLTEKDRDGLIEEGEQLVRFIEDRAEAYEIRFADPV